LNGEIKKKNNFNKITKKFKKILQKDQMKKIIYYEFGLKNEIENQKSYKKTNEKN
jgi:hypothetical protein